MLTFLTQNIGTIMVGLILLLSVAAVLRIMKKKGTACGCGCSGCPSAGMCHKKK